MGRWAARLGAVVAGAAVGLAAAMVIPGIAYAHVHVEAEPAVAGARNAVLTFEAAAESRTAGVASVRIVLPEGISPSDVTLADAPAGWTLTPGSDGYTVGGPALPVGQDAVHSVRVAQLPDSTELVFKALVNYSDGGVDRWIEEPSEANPNPENPAAVLRLAPNPNPAPETTEAGPTTPATTPPAAVMPSATASPEAAAPDDNGSGTAWVWWLAAAVVIGSGIAVVLLRRRNRASAS